MFRKFAPPWIRKLDELAESLPSLPASDARSRVVAPDMHRRRSQDPDLADRLVVEAGDGDAMPLRSGLRG